MFRLKLALRTVLAVCRGVMSDSVGKAPDISDTRGMDDSTGASISVGVVRPCKRAVGQVVQCNDSSRKNLRMSIDDMDIQNASGCATNSLIVAESTVDRKDSLLSGADVMSVETEIGGCCDLPSNEDANEMGAGSPVMPGCIDTPLYERSFKELVVIAKEEGVILPRRMKMRKHMAPFDNS